MREAHDRSNFKLNPDKRKEVVKRYKDANKEQGYQYIINDWEGYILRGIKARCRIHSIDFNLDKSDIIIPDKCPYLGVPLTRIQGKGRQETNPSVDRIDPSYGYIKGNIEIISDLANRMKSNARPNELVSFAKEVLRRYE